MSESKFLGVALATTFAATGCADRVEGKVTFADGTPASGVALLFMNSSDDLVETKTDKSGFYSAEVPSDYHSLVAATEGASSDAEPIDAGSVALHAIPQPLKHSCPTTNVWGPTDIDASGDIRIQYYGDIDYLFTPFWMPSLQRAGLSKAETSAKYKADPNNWDQWDEEGPNGSRKRRVLVPSRYRYWVKYVYPRLNLSENVYACDE